MKVDIEKLENLLIEADKIFLKPEGEKVLLDLLKVKAQVEEAIKAAKGKLEEAALKLNPNFSSIEADNVKVYYRQYGARYKIDESRIGQLPKELYAVKESYYANTKAIDVYTEEHGGLPVGIITPERKKQITFSLKGEKEENGES